MAYIDVEVGIVNIKSVRSLLEVDVRNAVRAHIVIINKAERGSRSDLLHKRSSDIDIGAREQAGNRRVG